MLLTVVVLAQLVLDVVVIVMLTRGRGRFRPEREAAPPPWYQEFVHLAEDLLLVTEPVLTALESPGPHGVPGAASASASDTPGPASGRYRDAFALLRGGRCPEEVARVGRVSRGELRLMENLVAAESRIAAARGT